MLYLVSRVYLHENWGHSPVICVIREKEREDERDVYDVVGCVKNNAE